MTRKEFMDTLTADQKKQLEEIKKRNSEVMKANEVVKNINADLRLCLQDIKDADSARATATQTLGAAASNPISMPRSGDKGAKYGEVETLMLKDTAAKATPPSCGQIWGKRKSA